MLRSLSHAILRTFTSRQKASGGHKLRLLSSASCVEDDCLHWVFFRDKFDSSSVDGPQIRTEFFPQVLERPNRVASFHGRGVAPLSVLYTDPLTSCVDSGKINMAVSIVRRFPPQHSRSVPKQLISHQYHRPKPFKLSPAHQGGLPHNQSGTVKTRIVLSRLVFCVRTKRRAPWSSLELPFLQRR